MSKSKRMSWSQRAFVASVFVLSFVLALLLAKYGGLGSTAITP